MFLPQNIDNTNKSTHFIGQSAQAGHGVAEKVANHRLDHHLTLLQPHLQGRGQAPVKTRLDDEGLKKPHDSHTQWLGQEKQTLDNHHRQQKESWLKQSQRLTDIVKNNEGVWISTKLFYVVGSLSLLSIITLAIEIAFYVYFHWIH